jgi:hypothetical protein
MGELRGPDTGGVTSCGAVAGHFLVGERICCCVHERAVSVVNMSAGTDVGNFEPRVSGAELKFFPLK